MSTPLSAATSIRTPRVISEPTCSIAPLVKPLRIGLLLGREPYHASKEREQFCQRLGWKLLR
jgi:hypothetical protein